MRESKTLSNIKFLYGMSRLNYDVTFKKTKLLLSIYKALVSTGIDFTSSTSYQT